jgi:hypothetical protein
MKRFLVILALTLVMLAGTACVANTYMPPTPPIPSENVADLVEVSGSVKEVKEGLVLITTQDQGEFMLRFSENSKWADGVDTKIETGNKITCLVKLEPTFAPPSQGEVFKVVSNNK